MVDELRQTGDVALREFSRWDVDGDVCSWILEWSVLSRSLMRRRKIVGDGTDP